MVKIIRDVIKKICNEINTYLKASHNILKWLMRKDYFQFVLTGKKKYFGISHVTVPNFKPKKLFIRGIDTVKQGKPTF